MALPNLNNNPGDLRLAGQDNASPGQGGFAEFPTGGDGFAALANEINLRMTNHPNQNLMQFADSYAPASDGNNPAKYAADLANQLGVSPDTGIGTLKSRMGDFVKAVSTNEGWKAPTEQGIGGIGAGAALAGGAVLAGGALAAPEVLGGEGLLGTIENGIGGVVGDIGGAIGKLVGGGGSSTGADLSSPTQTTPDVNLGSTPPPQEPTQPQEPPITETPAQPSQMYNDIQNLASQAVGGNQVMQEGVRRGVDPVAVLSNTDAGAKLQPDQNGNIDKISPLLVMDSLLSQEKNSQTGMAQSMTSPTHLEDMRQASHAIVDKAMADTGDLGSAHKEVDRIFNDYLGEQSDKVDRNGKKYVSQFVTPARLQKKKELLSVNEKDFARPRHERSAAAHVKEAMRQRLSQIAKQEGVKGWDETNKRLEGMILAKKLITKIPKKAPRNIRKEFAKNLLAGAAGAVVGRMFRNHPLAGGVAGYLIDRQLGKKEYKKTGSKKDRNRKAPVMHSLLSRTGVKPGEKEHHEKRK